MRFFNTTYRQMLIMAIVAWAVVGVPSVASAISIPDDPSVRGEGIKTLSQQLCGNVTDCQQRFEKGALSCTDNDTFSTGIKIADCIISQMGPYQKNFQSKRDFITQEIEAIWADASESQHQDNTKSKCFSTILGFPAWYNGLQCDKDGPKISKLNDVWVIVLNMIRWLLGVAAYAAGIFIVWGGFKYIKSQGDPSSVASAKTTIVQAIGGLVIALISTALVAYVQGLIK